jgi:hypothetical protein
MANYSARIERLIARLEPKLPEMYSVVVGQGETMEQAAARYAEENGLPPTSVQRVLDRGFFTSESEGYVRGWLFSPTSNSVFHISIDTKFADE